MPRSQATLPISLWDDPEFAVFPYNVQRMFLLLYTQPNLSPACHLPFTPRRWASMGKGSTEAGVVADLNALESAGWALLDWEWDEVVIRRLIPPAGHKQLQAALRATTEIFSLRLRQAALDAALSLGHDSHTAARGARAGFIQTRLQVHRRDGYRCIRCRWAPMVPDGYDGRHALGEVLQDELSGQYKVRILELDHVHPQSLGGKFEPDNLQSLCNSCNASKGARV